MSAVGRFLGTLVLGVTAGIPVLAGIAVESAVTAWIIDELQWFGDPGFGTVFLWAFGIQAGLVCLFAVPAIIAKSFQAARHGWEAVSS